MESLHWSPSPLFPHAPMRIINHQEHIDEGVGCSENPFGEPSNVPLIEQDHWNLNGDSGGQPIWDSGITIVEFGSCSLINENNGLNTLVATSGSIDHSLDCQLLSITNSNTDASVEDDGISMIFSDSIGFLNFGSVSATESPDPNNIASSPNVAKLFTVNRPMPAKRMRSHEHDINTDSIHDSEGGFRLIHDDSGKAKRSRSSNISFGHDSFTGEPDAEAIQQMKEMMYRAAAFRPVSFVEDVVEEKPRRKNVRISSDPQTVAARQRRERVSDRLRVLQKLVPGGSKMDTASMLDEAAHYLKFLRSQVKALEALGNGANDHKQDSSSTLLAPMNYLRFCPDLSQSFPIDY
ncbi:hypothetical protein Droror1_Dr00013441 [Drosera rotundifolia]